MQNGEYNFPIITRAREYRLYSNSGKKYLDFFQEEGRAILGHRPAKLSNELKNVMSRGLYASYPSIYEYRLFRASKVLLPDYNQFWVFSDWLNALSFLKETGGICKIDEITDPLFCKPGKVSFWRPFLEVAYGDIVIPVVPFPGSFAPIVIAGKGPEENYFIDGVSPIIEAGMAKVIYSLKNFISFNPYDKLLFSAPGWTRKGPYLLFEGDNSNYRKVCKIGVDNGIIFNPKFGSFSILPAEFDYGELKGFLRMVKNV